jgi:hypothetical protein
VDLGGTGCETVHWMKLTEYRAAPPRLVNKVLVMKFQIPRTDRRLLTSSGTVSFSRRTGSMELVYYVYRPEICSMMIEV